MRPLLAWLAGGGRRVAITVAGVSLIVLGCVLAVLPGPLTLPFLFAGLAVLSREYEWARNLQARLKERVATAASKLRGRRDR